MIQAFFTSWLGVVGKAQVLIITLTMAQFYLIISVAVGQWASVTLYSVTWIEISTAISIFLAFILIGTPIGKYGALVVMTHFNSWWPNISRYCLWIFCLSIEHITQHFLVFFTKLILSTESDTGHRVQYTSITGIQNLRLWRGTEYSIALACTTPGT